MTKVKRYFDKDETKSEEKVQKQSKPKLKSKKKSKDVITFKVDVKPRTWSKRKGISEEKDKEVNYRRKAVQGRVPIPDELLKKHSRGTVLDVKNVKTRIHKKKLEQKEKKLKFAHEQAARVEILLPEEQGFLEADDGETTTQFTQKQIIDSVDITAAAKHFELKLTDFGPYRFKYSRNGRHMLLGGKMGHVAAFDWVTKKLHCEINVMESVLDVSWLHIETMFAVAQKEWVYIYDNQGIELHCVKALNKVCRMEYLPYHFLLATASDEGFLSWLDISIGQMVSQYNTKLGRLTMLTQNPYNAVLCLGHAKGVVSMWAPNTREPLAKMLCHRSPMTALHIDPKGLYMATTGLDRNLKIWDIRKLEGPLQTYILKSSADNLAFSQNNLLAVGLKNVVEIYRDYCVKPTKRAYLYNRFSDTIGNINFCPYEDVLGVATEKGFSSLIVPGAGEPNFDALEANPFQTKSQRREAEVKALLEKIQPELITLDPTIIAEVDVPTLKDKVEAKKKLLFLKPPKIDYEPRNKGKGRGGSAKIARNKKIVKETAKKEFIKSIKNVNSLDAENKEKEVSNKPYDVLDRFLPKK